MRLPADMRSYVRAHEVSFLDLVQGEKQFQVPLYQRTYSWTDAQLAQLWRDLLSPDLS